METMYQAEALFASHLTSSVASGDSTIHVNDIEKFPDAPNYATIINYGDENLETIHYTGKDTGNNELTGVTRGVEGSDQSWDEGEIIGRFHTAVEQNTVIDNIETLDSDLNSHIGSGGTAHDTATTSVHGFMSSSDKSKLDGIDDNANNYSLETHGNEYHDENYTTYDSSDFDNDFDGANISRLNNDSGYTTYTFSEDYQDLSNRTHGNEDHTSTFYSSGDDAVFNQIETTGVGSVSFGSGSQTSYDVTQDDHDSRFMFYIDENSTFSSGFGLRTHNDGDGYGWMLTVDHNGTVNSGGELQEDGSRVATRTWTDSNFNNYTFSEDYQDLSNRTHGNEDHTSNYTTTSPSDVNSSNWGDYEIQKNGSDTNGVINFKT